MRKYEKDFDENIDERYQNGKIYKLICKNSDLVYIGSTIRSLKARLTMHKSLYKIYVMNNGKYCSSFVLFDLDEDVQIELLEEYPCNSKQELLKREGEITKRFLNSVNENIAGRTSKEYYEDNKEKYSEYRKQYYVENKEKYAQYRKEYYKDNKEKYSEYSKKYNEENKEEKKEYMDKYNSEYYQKNREIILEKLKERVECKCGRIFAKSYKSGHEKSKIHIDYMSSL